jgi:SAM-dependent methyltransferase
MFNLKKLSESKSKAKSSLKNSDFFQFTHQDLIDRITPINKKFEKILLIKPAIEELLTKPLKSNNQNCTVEISNDLNTNDDNFDLIIFPFGLHWISDIQNFLSYTRKLLSKDGIFICNFPGGGTLQNLRHLLIELELKHSSSHAPHISPFIRFEQMTPLLQQAGFIENIIDHQNIEIEAPSALQFMKAMQNLGESNTLQNKIAYSINKQMLRDLQNNNTLFIDHINLITFISCPTKGGLKLYHETYNLL